MTFSYEFELAQAEQVRASRVVFNRRISTRISYVVVPLAMGLLGAWGHYATGGRATAEILPVVLAGATASVAAIYATPYWAVRALRRKNRAAVSVQRYELAPSGISASALGASGAMSWQNVVEARETTEFLLFYVSVAWAYLLPKRVIPQADLPQLRDSLREGLGERAQ